MTDTFAPAKKPTIQNTSKTLTSRRQVAQFGDGYSQRAADGLNSIVRKWTLTWAALTQAEKDYIEGVYIDKGGGVEAVFYQMPGDGIVRKWILVDNTEAAHTGP